MRKRRFWGRRQLAAKPPLVVALVAAADRLTADRACYLASNAVSTITASLIASAVTVAMRTQAGGLGKAQHSRAPLLIAHAQLTVRPKRNARKLLKRLRQGTILVSRLIKQAATSERICRRTKRRRNLRAGLV